MLTSDAVLPRASYVAVAVALLASLLGAAASAEGTPRRAIGTGLELVASVPFPGGTHLVTATIKGRDYLFAASAPSSGTGDLRVIDVTSPERPRVVATLPCSDYQGHLQLSHDKKTLILGVDRPAGESTCMPAGEQGFITINVRNPRRPKPLGYAAIPGGSHSTAAHPRKPRVYNAPEGSPAPERRPPDMEVWSIANPRKPKLVNTIPMPRTHSPHDISFNKSGTMAAIANISSFHLLDTRDPVNPVVVYSGQCPGCQHTHEARFTRDGKTLVVNDEALGGPYPCPGGALYFYELAGAPESTTASLTGTYSIEDAGANSGGEAGFCTPHVFDISRDGTRVAASWHSAGVRYLDITKHSGVTVGADSPAGGEGVRELGSYTSEGGDSFTAKFLRGPYIYSIDIPSGLQIFR
ncbi:MAG TPA: hypothetical protein VIG64_01815, partial [Actinomycetota bacterium]